MGDRGPASVAVDAWLFERTRRAKVRLITVDRRLHGVPGVPASHVACDNLAGGRRAAAELAGPMAAATGGRWSADGKPPPATPASTGSGRVSKPPDAPAPRGLVLGPRMNAKAFLKALQSNEPQDLFILADFVALHFMAFLRAHGMGSLPAARLGLITFDDLEVSRAFGLAALDQPLAEIGSRAVRLAAGFLRNPAAPDEEILLPPTLVERPSY